MKILFICVRRNENVAADDYRNISQSHVCLFVTIRWDNGETEKLSPWDLETIPDDGKETSPDVNHITSCNILFKDFIFYFNFYFVQAF